MTYSKKLLENRDLLFKSHYSLSLDYIDNIYTHVVDISLRVVQIRNNIDYTIVISRKTRLDQLKKYKQNEYFSIEAHYVDLAITE